MNKDFLLIFRCFGLLYIKKEIILLKLLLICLVGIIYLSGIFQAFTEGRIWQFDFEAGKGFRWVWSWLANSDVWEVCSLVRYDGFVILLLMETKLVFGTVSFMIGLQGVQWFFDFHEGKIWFLVVKFSIFVDGF